MSCKEKGRHPRLIHGSHADTILLVTMDFTDDNLLKPIIDKITAFYHIPVRWQISALPASGFYSARNRYNASELIRFVDSVNDSEYKFVVGLTSKDICTKQDQNPCWGIFGLGTLNNTGCVISSFRLKRNASLTLLTERIQKVVLHEIGHNNGLDHCTSPYPCFMKAANGKIAQVDSDPMDLCVECKKKMN